jgi:hypothetical protein
MSENLENKVLLKCSYDRTSRKLRVRIISPGYLNTANCQFPRDLREDGRHFIVDKSAISLITTRGKYYYSIKNRQLIKIIEETELPTIPAPKIKVYQDTEQEECLLCYDAPKESVFDPCGHFYTCKSCSSKCKLCPICRVPIISLIDKKDMEE